MSLCKARIVGFVVGIVLLACFMDKGIYGYEGGLHEAIVDVTFEMMSPKYHSLPREYLKIGSTQPDEDRKKAQKRGDFKDNEEHKRDTMRINNNYGEAITRYKKFAGEGKPEEAQNEGARILAKAFHYVSDQTEPEEMRGFSNLMGRGFRGTAQKMLQAIMADGKAKKHFSDKVSRLYQEYQFNPRDEKFIKNEIPKIRNDLKNDLEKKIKEKAKNEINRLIFDYLAKIVAIQNLMLEQFVMETQMESGSFHSSRPTVQPQPPEERRSILGDWVGLWDRDDGRIRIDQKGNEFIGYITQFPPNLNRALKVGDEIFRVKAVNRGYEGTILKIYTVRKDKFVITPAERVRCTIVQFPDNTLRITIWTKWENFDFNHGYYLKPIRR